MSSTNHELPQEWPKHLASDAEISVNKVTPPIGEPLLDFTKMHYTTFEQFCWWLLKKEQRLIGCKRLGGNGTAQGGIDLLAHDEQQPDRLNVFECKAWKDFGPANLTEAIDAFLQGDWVGLTNNYTLILAQQEIGPVLQRRWLKEKKRLVQAGVDGDLWTAHTLTLRVQAYPDILSKFFPWASVEIHANKWMQRVAFHELVSKAFFDPREHVARWARELAGQSQIINKINTTSGDFEESSISIETDTQQVNIGTFLPATPFVIDGTYRTVNQSGNGWNFKGLWLSLSAILPDQNFTHASVAITFNRPDMQGIVLTVGHAWLLQKLLFTVDAPLTPQYRGFVVAGSVKDDEQYLIDLPNCRLFLQKAGVQELAGSMDLLTTAIRDALVKLELAWHASHFPFVMWAGKKVALGAVSKAVWNEIGWFAVEHDVSNGSTPWHMFDGNNQVLKPYHERSTSQFSAGYHGVIYAVEIDGLSRADEVVLLWQSNGLNPNQELTQRGWWSAEFTLQWLIQELLPEIKRQLYVRRFGKIWQRLFKTSDAKEFSDRLDEVFVIRDLRERPLMYGGKWYFSIVECAQKLQYFFNSITEPEPYIRKHDMEKLYEAVAVIAKGERGYVGYAASRLSLDNVPTDHADLIRMIGEHIQTGRVVANCYMADYAFRAMLEMLNSADDWLSELEKVLVRESMVPFAAVRDDQTLIDRHTRWT